MTSVLGSNKHGKDSGKDPYKQRQRLELHSQGMSVATRSGEKQGTESPLELSGGNVALQTPVGWTSILQSYEKINLLY